MKILVRFVSTGSYLKKGNKGKDLITVVKKIKRKIKSTVVTHSRKDLYITVAKGYTVEKTYDTNTMVSSSRSTTKMKATRFSPIQQQIFKKVSCSNARRLDTIFTKARQLSIMCAVEVCVIWYGSDGDLKIWPEDREKVKDMAERYVALSEEKRRNKSVNLHEFLKKENENKKKNKKVGDVTFPISDNIRSRFGNYSGDEIRELIQSLEHKRTEFLQKIQNKKNNNMGTHEPPMNHHHLQQQSDQVPFSMFNHDGNGDITQFPSVSASDFNQGQYMPPFPPLELMNYPYPDMGNSSITQIPQVSASDSNQEQSLAPLPPQLMTYSYSDVGNYLGSLGVQGTEINGFQNMNTGSFWVQGYGSYGFQNMNTGSFGVQGCGSYGFQNMNMLSYDNIHINGSSCLY